MTKAFTQATDQSSRVNDYVAGILMTALLLLSGVMSLAQFAI